MRGRRRTMTTPQTPDGIIELAANALAEHLYNFYSRMKSTTWSELYDLRREIISAEARYALNDTHIYDSLAEVTRLHDIDAKHDQAVINMNAALATEYNEGISRAFRGMTMRQNEADVKRDNPYLKVKP